MALTRSCALNTSIDSPEHAHIAESLGYARAWFYDSPAIAGDVWMQLARAAERTERIGLGPGVLVPALRHPMATATAISDLVAIAGQGRVGVGIGAGFTGRLTLGKRPSTWAFVADYISVVRALLRGEQPEWEGARIAMLHRPGFTAARPVEVPFLIGAAGAKGIAVAHEYGDGVFTTAGPIAGFDWCAHLVAGTVLEDGEDPGSIRAIAAAGHAVCRQVHHAIERGSSLHLPGFSQWVAAYAGIPPEIRHLEIHAGHLWAVSERDRPFVTGEVLATSGAALSAAAWRDKLGRLEDQGATEIVYQPAGPDVARELEAFAEALDGI